VSEGLVKELANFEELIRSVDTESWAAPTRCAGWSVADVAAHVVGSMVDVIEGRVDGLGTEAVTAREVNERKGRSNADLADELARTTKLVAETLTVFDEAAWEAPAPGGYEGTLGDGVEALWYDAWLHGDDIRAALGQPTAHGRGVRAAVSHVGFELGKRGWGPAVLDFDGVGRFEVKGGSGHVVSGDAVAFVLEATGRAPAGSGPGAPLDIYAA
jgi:uncharacterized protein (TIGR03083 family)